MTLLKLRVTNWLNHHFSTKFCARPVVKQQKVMPFASEDKLSSRKACWVREWAERGSIKVVEAAHLSAGIATSWPHAHDYRNNPGFPKRNNFYRLLALRSVQTSKLRWSFGTHLVWRNELKVLVTNDVADVKVTFSHVHTWEAGSCTFCRVSWNWNQNHL